MYPRTFAKVLTLPLAALGLIVGLSQPAAAQNWQPVNHRSGRFTVQMPDYASEISQPSHSPAGTSIMHVISVELNGKREWFAICYSDAPSAADLSNVEQVLNGLRDGHLGDDARITTERAITLDGRPGKYFVAKSKNGTLTASRIFLDGRRIYQVMYESKDGQMPAAANTFLDSFRITR